MRNFFLAVSDQTIPALEEKGGNVYAKMAITQNKKHEVISVWEYCYEAHMKMVGSAMPNSPLYLIPSHQRK